MPVMCCYRRGKPGYRAVSTTGLGDCFTYQPGEEADKLAAKRAAHRQLTRMAAKIRSENIRAVIETIACI